MARERCLNNAGTSRSPPPKTSRKGGGEKRSNYYINLARLAFFTKKWIRTRIFQDHDLSCLQPGPPLGFFEGKGGEEELD